VGGGRGGGGLWYGDQPGHSLRALRLAHKAQILD
jgi:hypothetical protein